MSDAVLVALIAGGLSVAAEVVIAVASQKATMKELEKQSALADARLEKSQAVTETKLEELTREVRAHNNFAQRLPVLEEQIKVANHRIEDLEHKAG
jgi:TolA-binding protein